MTAAQRSHQTPPAPRQARPYAVGRCGLRAGLSAVETALVAPLLLMLVFLMFFFYGSLRHKQQMLATLRAGVWHHMRIRGEDPRGAPLVPDPNAYIYTTAWTGNSITDEIITVRYHMQADTGSQITAYADVEPAGGVDRLAGLVSTGGGGRATAAYYWAVAQRAAAPGTETWQLTATHGGRTTSMVGSDVDRTLTMRLRIDTGAWLDNDAQGSTRVLAVDPDAQREHQLCEQLVNQLIADRLVDIDIAQRLQWLSVLRSAQNRR